MNRSRLTLMLALTAGLLAPAQAQSSTVPKRERVQQTVSGTVESLDTSKGIMVIRMESGTRKTAHLQPTCQYRNGDAAVTASFFAVGNKAVLRLCSAFSENPLQVDLVCDVMSSGKYVATHAPAPYDTPMGDFATTNGVGGTPQGNLGIARPDHTIGVLGNGGKLPGPNIPGMPENQGAKMAAAQQLLNQTTPNMMNGDVEEEPGMGGPTTGTGVPVNMQAKVLRSDPSTHLMQVCPVGSTQPQNVMLSPSVNLPMLQQGALVNIQGQTNPSSGVIEATNVFLVNPTQ